MDMTNIILKTDEITYQIRKCENPEISIWVDTDKWIIKIGRDGFKFNHEEYPNALADDFAEAFVTILERNYDVTMEKRK